MLHALKTHPEYFAALEKGDKTFELRKDDRPFKIGDTLIAQEFNPSDSTYTGKEVEFKISYILRDASLMGLSKDYAILGLTERKLVPHKL